ncbi:DNA-damage-inducible protein D [compost metagenome]
MKTQKTQQQNVTTFETYRKTDTAGNEYWSARELAKLLGYEEYRSFLPVLKKAKESCRNSNQKEENHFEDVLEIKALDSATKRKFHDVKLSRYGCYLSIENADPSHQSVALAQTYFVVQSRITELNNTKHYNTLKTTAKKRQLLREKLAKYNLQLAAAARKAGIIKPADYAIFQNHGYMGLYGGMDAQDIREKKHLGANESILDHMETTELSANLSRAAQTQQKLTRDKVHDIEEANSIHFAVGLKIRNAMQEIGNLLPEDLPSAPTLKNEAKKKVVSKNKNSKETG